MKRAAIAIFLLACLILAIVMVVNSLTTGMTKNAEEFFLAVSEGQLDTARNYLSTSFRNSVDPAEFRAYLQNGGLDRYETSTWDSRSYSGSQGKIAGVVYLQDGSHLPIKMVFVQEKSEWHIHSIEVSLPGISPHTVKKSIPPLNKLEFMASSTIKLFGNCVLTNDFTPFYSQVSALWQSRTSAARLLQAFQPFVDNNIDLSKYDHVDPTFSETPLIDEHGTLLLKGYFAHETETLSFDLRYAFEYPEWKLLGLNVSL